MADKMYVILTARKEVTDKVEARAVYDTVKQKLQDRPDIELTGHCSNHFDLTNE